MAFKKKEPAKENTTVVDLDQDKVYQFELVKTYDKYKPTDEKGHPIGLPYPPIYGVPNRAVVFDENTGRQRRMRFVYGQESIFEDEQDIEPTPLDMASADNALDFINGILRVNGNNTAKLAALMSLDMFEGKKKRVITNTVPIYRLINPDEVTNNLLKNLDLAFEAESAARNMSEEDMLVVASVLGINMSMPKSDIKKDFILQAKNNPANFMKQAVNPSNKFVYAFKNAFIDSLISLTINPGKLVWTGNQAVICEVNASDDQDVVAEKLGKKAAMQDKDAMLLYTKLENEKAAV